MFAMESLCARPFFASLGGDLFHGNGWVRKLLARDRAPLGDELTAHHEFWRRVDRLDRLYDPALEVEDRELAGRRVAADQDVVALERHAGDLQLDVVLVGPEPGRLA